MPKKLRLVCVTALLPLICGCQSSSPAQTRLVEVGCQPPTAPALWFMQPREPNLTQRMLNELSESPTTAIKD